MDLIKIIMKIYFYIKPAQTDLGSDTSIKLALKLIDFKYGQAWSRIGKDTRSYVFDYTEFEKTQKKFKNLRDFGKIRRLNGKFLKKVYAHKTPVSPRLTFGNCFFQFSDFSFFQATKNRFPKTNPKA